MPSGSGFTFAPFHLDLASKRLLRDGTRVPLTARHFDLLAALVQRAGSVVDKEELMRVGWREVAVTDSSLLKIIAHLRRLLDPDDPASSIETVARVGYRFVRPVITETRPYAPPDLDALLAPHRDFVDGRALLETLHLDQALRARILFADVVQSAPQYAPAHVGLANACVMAFEATRADREPRLDALQTAVHHATEACRLDPTYGDAWATLAFVLARSSSSPQDALAAARRATTIEPDNWRHLVRWGSVASGEERLRAVRKALVLVPGFPFAHLLAATVLVARQTLDEAERDVILGIAGHDAQRLAEARFSATALHWLHGLLLLARCDESGSG